jgi:prevent-host-death family protein
MKPMNIAELKAHLSEVIATVNKTGNSVTIAKYGKPIAKIVPFSEEVKERKLGFALHLLTANNLKVQAQVDTPTDNDTLDAFYQ